VTDSLSDPILQIISFSKTFFLDINRHSGDFYRLFERADPDGNRTMFIEVIGGDCANNPGFTDISRS
jgi:hypothetical protein